LSNQNQSNQPLSVEMVETYVWAFVVVVVTFILAGIVMFMLYSLAFVTQPIKSMAPIDQAFSKMLNDIVLLVVGGIGGVMSRKGVQAIAERMAPSQPTPPPQPQAVAPSVAPAPAVSSGGMFDFNFNGFKNPELDESWTPGPPPTTPPEHMEEDAEREVLAAARNEVKAA
jgi:hypothetical protein